MKILVFSIMTLFALSGIPANADVLVDNMEDPKNKSLSGGYWFATQDGKQAGNINDSNSHIEFPSYSEFSFYSLAQNNTGETGRVALLKGVIGSRVDYPFLAMGFNLTGTKDTLDLSSVTHIVFEARGIGRWGIKFKSSVANAIAVEMGKSPGQVDWRYEFGYTIDSHDFSWIAVDVDYFTGTTSDFRDYLYTSGTTVSDALEKVYQFQWGTVGYQSWEAGAPVRLEVRNVILIGDITKVGASETRPTATQLAAIKPLSIFRHNSRDVFSTEAGNSAVIFLIGNSPAARLILPGVSAVYSLRGRKVHRIEQGAPGLYILK